MKPNHPPRSHMASSKKEKQNLADVFDSACFLEEHLRRTNQTSSRELRWSEAVTANYIESIKQGYFKMLHEQYNLRRRNTTLETQLADETKKNPAYYQQAGVFKRANPSLKMQIQTEEEPKKISKTVANLKAKMDEEKNQRLVMGRKLDQLQNNARGWAPLPLPPSPPRLHGVISNAQEWTCMCGDIFGSKSELESHVRVGVQGSLLPNY